MGDEMKQERIPTLHETLYDLSRFMRGELGGGPDEVTDPIQSVTFLRDWILVTTCAGLWRFQPHADGNSTIDLISNF